MAVPAEFIELALAVVAGVLAGTVAGLFGVGGGIVAVPAAVFISGAAFHDAKAAALLVILAGGATALWRHHQARNVRWRWGAALAAGGVVGAVASSLWAEDLTETTLSTAFGAVLLLVAVRLVLKEPSPHEGRMHLWALVPLGFVGGMLTGLFGIGGGVAMVPIMVLLGAPIHLAVATSLVPVWVNAFAAAGTQVALGYLDTMVRLGVPLALGAVVGGRLGAHLALRAPARRLQVGFAVVLAVVGVRFIL